MGFLHAAGYRSAPSMLSVAKQVHIKAGHQWTDDLALAQREANRAAARGLGPPKKSEPFPL
eukprot:12920678-Prorocentrum_lima.AAC.1